MLRLNKRADYGILVLTVLARAPKERKSATDIASAFHLSRHMVASILKDLSRAGIVVGGRGVRGGYTLERPPEEIRLIEIIEAVEGPFALLDCCGPAARSGACGTTDVLCSARPVILELNQGIRGLLEKYTVLDLLGPGGPAAATPGEQVHA